MTVKILKGDCREVLRMLADESVHCVVTSPPYWGLRDYGTATWEEGDAGCDHKAGKNDTNNGAIRGGPFRDNCGKCGARRIDSQLGLESDFNTYVCEMVAVFREVRRVLRKDGTLWLNLGDSYASSINGRKAADIVDDDRTFRDKPFSTVTNDWQSRVGSSGNRGNLGADHAFRISDPIFKPKDLCGIPWRVAFALQADGWWLRQDIIWSKPNPMPESVTDRCTKAHEYLFLLSKSERYFYDAEAIREDGPSYVRKPGHCSDESADAYVHSRQTNMSIRTIVTNGRNKRSVWEIATAPFSEAHFATFPPALIEPCIKAGCPQGGTLLDPFGGAGTTGLVADRLGRNAILIELNPEYAAMADRRIRDDAGMFASVAAE